MRQRKTSLVLKLAAGHEPPIAHTELAPALPVPNPEIMTGARLRPLKVRGDAIRTTGDDLPPFRLPYKLVIPSKAGSLSLVSMI